MTDFTPHPLESIPEGEANDIDRVMESQLHIMQSRQDPTKRGQHPKAQALLRGTFEISDGAPEAMRVGVFARPRKFDALVRFSTGLAQHDSAGQGHGFAIKLLDVADSPTGTQDFILLDQPSFFIRDVAEYVQLFANWRDDPAGILNYFKDHPREFGLFRTFSVGIASHLEQQYWSEVPIAMGNGAARLTLLPEIANLSGGDPVSTRDGLRDALEEHFVKSRRSARFAFGVQAYVDEATTPIEDATSVWPTVSETIATLTLPPQNFKAPEQFEFCEHLSYTPWHCVPEHQPLGGIQRCRKRVYEESVRLRSSLNKVQAPEPTTTDLERLGATF